MLFFFFSDAFLPSWKLQMTAVATCKNCSTHSPFVSVNAIHILVTQLVRIIIFFVPLIMYDDTIMGTVDSDVVL